MGSPNNCSFLYEFVGILCSATVPKAFYPPQVWRTWKGTCDLTPLCVILFCTPSFYHMHGYTVMLVVFNPYLSYHQFIYFITLFIDCQICDLFCTCDGPEEPHEVSHRRAVFTCSCCSSMFMQNLSHFWMSEEACGRTLCLCVYFFTRVYLHLLSC